MIEPLGATAAVVGLISQYRTVLDLYERVLIATLFKKQFKALRSQLEFEETILLIWADEVGFADAYASATGTLNEEHHGNSSREIPRMHFNGAMAILVEMQQAFNDARGVEESYHVPANDKPIDDVHSTALSPRLTKLRKVILGTRQVGNRFMWMVRDAQKFQELIYELAAHRRRLFDVLPRPVSLMALERRLLTELITDAIREQLVSLKEGLFSGSRVASHKGHQEECPNLRPAADADIYFLERTELEGNSAATPRVTDLRRELEDFSTLQGSPSRQYGQLDNKNVIIEYKESPASMTEKKELNNFSDGVMDLVCFLNIVAKAPRFGSLQCTAFFEEDYGYAPVTFLFMKHLN